MKATQIKVQPFLRTLSIDLVLLSAACLVPTASHLLAWPIYQLNPMLLMLLAGMLLVRDRRNAYLMAVLLPMVSMLAVGMPTPLKALCMSAEFATVVFLSGIMRSWNTKFLTSFGSMALAVVGGKCVYYLLKALIISPAVLVSTPLWIQGLSVLAAALIFAALNQCSNA
ncbi:MAG: hypothetical protein IKG81_06425 [Bacteroidales bacterium]|nr:hypothetical protein [Bacteroidales bacterium]